MTNVTELVVYMCNQCNCVLKFQYNKNDFDQRTAQANFVIEWLRETSLGLWDVIWGHTSS